VIRGFEEKKWGFLSRETSRGANRARVRGRRDDERGNDFARDRFDVAATTSRERERERERAKGYRERDYAPAAHPGARKRRGSQFCIRAIFERSSASPACRKLRGICVYSRGDNAA